jgi:prevent-host-death family protein
MTEGEIEISATEFKAKCLGLLDRLSERKLKRVTVTKRGKPVAVLTPPKAAKEKTLPSIFGCLKDRTFVPPGYDLTKPVFEEEWDAEKGILHR